MRRPALWLVLLGVALAAFHAGWIGKPLTILQMNAGSYFGVFVRNWERFGFFELRGLPLMPQVVAAVADGVPYVRHPPGLSWLFHALGGSEWSMRLPSVVFGFVGAVALHRLLRTRFTPAAAFLGAASLLFGRAFVAIGQASYEILTVSCGLVVMALLVAPLASRRWTVAIMALAAFVGTWIDWGFAFLGLGCIVLVWQPRRPLRSALPLLLPGLAAVFAVGTIVLWATWALAGPGVSAIEAGNRDVLAMAGNAMGGERTTIGWFVDHMRATVPIVWGRWSMIVFVLGYGFAWWRYPRLTGATTWVAVAPYVVLKQPSDFVWLVYHSPLLAVTFAALFDFAMTRRHRWAGAIGAALAAVTLAGIARDSWAYRASGDTPFFARLGAVLTRATEGPRQAAVHGYLHGLAYYFEDPLIQLTGVFLPMQLEPLVQGYGGCGWKYLYLEPAKPGLLPPGMREFLEPFPRVRVPELEGALDQVGTEVTGGIREAWLYTLSEPPK